jgi:3',5'-cyclic AMP phosphodiesterase CpdA
MPLPRVRVAGATVGHVLGVRVLVVADSHLSERTPEAAEHWATVLAYIQADPPDLVVHAGDISADGSQRPTDLGYAHDQLQRVAAPLHVVPGNHDVGDNPGLYGPQRPVVDAERLGRFRALFGTDRFSVAAGHWRVVGIDAQLFGVGGVEETDQWDWLDAELTAAGPTTPVVLVSHKPLVPPAGDHDRPARYVPAPARDRLLALCDRADVRLVVSGHVHQSLRHQVDGRGHVWAPTTWAVLPDARQPPVGDKVPGLLELWLDGDGASDAVLRHPPGIRPRVIGVDAANPYADLPH